MLRFIIVICIKRKEVYLEKNKDKTHLKEQKIGESRFLNIKKYKTVFVFGEAITLPVQASLS